MGERHGGRIVRETESSGKNSKRTQTIGYYGDIINHSEARPLNETWKEGDEILLRIGKREGGLLELEDNWERVGIHIRVRAYPDGPQDSRGA